MHPSSTQLVVYGVVALLVIGMLAFRMRRMMRATPFDPYRAWILPALFLALSGSSLYAAQPAGMDWLWVIGVFLLGLVVGYFRGASISMSVDPPLTGSWRRARLGRCCSSSS